MLQDALRKALKDSSLESRVPETETETPAGGPDLPHPRDSAWGALLPSLPRTATLGRFQQESIALEKTWKKSGKRRESKALSDARTKFLKQYEKAAWKAIKTQWNALDYPERLYRRLKSDRIEPSAVAHRLHTRRAQQMSTASGEVLWTWVTTGKLPKD